MELTTGMRHGEIIGLKPCAGRASYRTACRPSQGRNGSVAAKDKTLAPHGHSRARYGRDLCRAQERGQGRVDVPVTRQ